jgi:hypothetical protein
LVEQRLPRTAGWADDDDDEWVEDEEEDLAEENFFRLLKRLAAQW